MHIDDDLRFLIACCQTEPLENDIDLILSYPTTNNYQLLTTMALRHGILPLVYNAIKKLSQSDLSGSSRSTLPTESPSTIDHRPSTEILSALKQQYMQIVQRNMLMTGELIKIMSLLRENHIDALAFKGPTLAQMAYGDIALRQYGDLDVLVKKEDIYRIDTLLQSQGYERLLVLTPAQESIWIKYAHDLGLIHPKNGLHFEMHWSLLDEDYPMQVDLEDFWKERQVVKINGYSVPAFSHENLLYYLCIHGSKHLWERIEWIKDLDLLIRNEDIDWDVLIAKAEGSGFEKMVYLGLSLSASLFATPLPEMIHGQITEHQQLDVLSDFVLDSWQSPKSTFAKTAAMLKLFPGIKEQAIYLHKIILKPSFNEYWAIDLPKGLYWGYYLVRPYLLVKKYFTRN